MAWTTLTHSLAEPPKIGWLRCKITGFIPNLPAGKVSSELIVVTGKTKTSDTLVQSVYGTELARSLAGQTFAARGRDGGVWPAIARDCTTYIHVYGARPNFNPFVTTHSSTNYVLLLVYSCAWPALPPNHENQDHATDQTFLGHAKLSS